MMGSSDHNNQIVKGKRTKRQRSLSPFGVAAAATVTSGSSSSSGGGELEGGVMDIDCCYNSVSAVSSPTTTTTSGGELIYESSSTEEEQDMANCLIMLAQGDAPRQQQQQIQESLIKSDKLISSRKFTGVVTTAGSGGTSTNKTGFYVYECKTCNRSFPSFQALGGHRASHKKPKATASAAEDKKSSSSSMVFPPLKDDFEDAHGSQFNKITSSPPFPPPLLPVSLQVATNTTTAAAAAATKGSKIHECSICGSEFTSGQALGGHMRRHRSAVTVNNQVVMSVAHTSTIIESNSSGHHHHDHEIKPANRSILSLDLNLPAPEDDHLRDSKFQFGSSTQPPHSLVFSAPALVHCHY